MWIRDLEPRRLRTLLYSRAYRGAEVLKSGASSFRRYIVQQNSIENERLEAVVRTVWMWNDWSF